MRISDWSSDVCSSDLDEGFEIVGYDGMTDYYDPQLKRRRHQKLLQNARLRAVEAMLEDRAAFDGAVDALAPDIIVHLAGQAGVRYSLDEPASYVQSNLVGGFHVLEAARRHGVTHLLMARSEEHTSELQSLMRISYAVFCLKKKTHTISTHQRSHI